MSGRDFPVLAFALAAIGLVLAGCSSAQKQEQSFARPPALVKIQAAQTEKVQQTTNYTAAAKSRHSVALTPQIDGTIRKILVQAGDMVKQGEPLIVISPEHQEASVNSSQAAHSSISQDLQTAKQMLASLVSQREAKQSNLHLAKDNKERFQALSESGAVSKLEYDQRVNALETAQSELTSTEAQISAQKATINRIEHQIAQAGANLHQEQVQLQYYTIKAPFAGIVGEIPVKVGSYVNTTSALTTVTANQPLEIHIDIPVELSSSLKIGMPVELLDARDKMIGDAKVSFVAPNVSPDSQTVLIKAAYDNADAKLRADQLLKARIVWGKHEGLKVPTEAVVHQAGEDFIFIAESGKTGMSAKQVPVQLGDIEGSSYQVVSGIKPGDKVIISGVQNLSDKAPISVSQ